MGDRRNPSLGRKGPKKSPVSFPYYSPGVEEEVGQVLRSIPNP